MGRGYFPVAKLQSYNQGKGGLLYPNNPVNLKANSRGWASTEKPKMRSKANGISDFGVVEQNQGPRTASAKAALGWMLHIRKQRKGWQIEGANVRSFFSFRYV